MRLADRRRALMMVQSNVVIPPTSLAELSAVVRAGKASQLTIGTQFNISWTDVATNTSYQVPVDIVAIQNVEDENGIIHEAAIIQWHYATPFTIQFDAPERVIATETTAVDGLYYYGLTGSTYTLLQLSAGDTIPYSDYDNVYKNAVKDTTREILRYGYNRYRDSAWRQFLCSEAGVGQWWTATHVGDCPPSELNSRAGFLSGFSAADLALIQKSKITCKTNNTTDHNVIDTMYDKWYLASRTEMYGTTSGYEGYDGTYFPYWKTATGLASPSDNANAGRITYYLNNQTRATGHRLRTSANSNSHASRTVKSDGKIESVKDHELYPALPVCAIY